MQAPDLAKPGEYLPVVHCTHAVAALASISVWPGEQASHVFVALLANWPASHGVQLVRVAWLTWPAVHWSQVVAPASAWDLPSAQSMHSVALSPSLSCFPSGQTVHSNAPALAYHPGSHCWHASYCVARRLESAAGCSRNDRCSRGDHKEGSWRSAHFAQKEEEDKALTNKTHISPGLLSRRCGLLHTQCTVCWQTIHPHCHCRGHTGRDHKAHNALPLCFGPSLWPLFRSCTLHICMGAHQGGAHKPQHGSK